MVGNVERSVMGVKFFRLPYRLFLSVFGKILMFSRHLGIKSDNVYEFNILRKFSV